ncbi:uncharacterized protein V6R79_025591 [Siganus canaliculatus]
MCSTQSGNKNGNERGLDQNRAVTESYPCQSEISIITRINQNRNTKGLMLRAGDNIIATGKSVLIVQLRAAILQQPLKNCKSPVTVAEGEKEGEHVIQTAIHPYFLPLAFTEQKNPCHADVTVLLEHKQKMTLGELIVQGRGSAKAKRLV